MRKINKYILAAVLTILCALAVHMEAMAATQVYLSSVDSFAVFAGTSIVNDSGPTAISGDVGVSPGSSISGFPPGVIIGIQHIGDPAAVQAASDLADAYNDADTQTPNTTLPAELGFTTVTPGIYDSQEGYLNLSGPLVLDAQGNPDSIFIFKTSSKLTTAGSSHITLINGAQACNIFWKVGSSAIIGTNSVFEGNILALNSAALSTSATVEGGVFIRNGSVMLDTNTITKTHCPLLPPEPTPDPPPVIPDPPPVTDVAVTSSNQVSSTNYDAPLPLINITKIPSPLALPAGPGLVTYTYVATNVGVVSMRGVWVKDNLCDKINFISGDVNHNDLLDVGESWMYQCAKVVSQTETNTATAHGNANGWDGYDTANATVVVGVPGLPNTGAIEPPLIHIVVKPNIFVLPYGGGAVTYTYTVTNPGIAPLSDVSVIDDKCTGLPGRVVSHPGDLNKNNLLEHGEIWTFTCLSHLIHTTTSVGIAEGHTNGLTAIDFSPATVVVAISAAAAVDSKNFIVGPVFIPTMPDFGSYVKNSYTAEARWFVVFLIIIVIGFVVFTLSRRRDNII